MKKTTSLLLITISIFLFSKNAEAKLTKDQLEKKETGWYLTGLPLINFTTDDGLGYGARLYFYHNGEKTDPYFDEAPYFTQIYAQFYQTTEDFSYHELNLDQYNIFGTKFRTKTAIVYDRKINANFYGIGENTIKNKLTDINGIKYSTYDDYLDDFLKTDNYLYYKYNKYRYKKPKFTFDFFGDIAGPFKFLTGVEIKWVGIDTWDGKSFKDDSDDKHTSGATLLSLSKDSIEGFDGGWTNSVRFGIAFDTRDYDPDPTSGFYFDYSFQISHSLLGSEFNFYRSTLGARTYISLADPLVLALRIGYTDASGGTPFFEMQTFGFLFEIQEGLGGNRTHRGYPRNRFVAETMTLGNMELRYKIGEATPGSQRFAFKLIAFVDTGNVYDNASGPITDPRFSNYKFSYGGGLVIAWNMATILHIYYGASEEGSSISIDFNHAF